MNRRRVLPGAALVVVLAYSATACVLAGPVTPITVRLLPLASLTEPYLAQDWRLFAPDPVSEERAVLARGRCDGEHDGEWQDITTPALRSAQSTRLFPPRESRIVSNLLLARFSQDDVAARLAERSPRVDLGALEKAQEGAHRRAESALARYAARRQLCSTENRLEAVQFRYVFSSLPSWSERGSDPVSEVDDVFESAWVRL